MTDSLWIEEAAFPTWPPPGDDERCEVLVIGGGLAGCGAALALQDRGVDVLLVDRSGPGRGASGRNAGFVLLAHLFELPDRIDSHGESAVGALLSRARQTHRRLAERFAGVAEHRRTGSLMLSMAGDDEEAQSLERAAALLERSGVEVRREDPHAALRGFGTQLRVLEDAGVHPAALVAAMSKGLKRACAAEVMALEGTLDDGSARTASGKVIRYRRALVATNAAAAALVPSLAGVVTPQRAQMLATSPLERRPLDEVAYAGWGFDYFRQREDGVVLLGGQRQRFLEAEASAHAEPTAEVQAALESYLARHLPFADGAPIAARWAGIMGFSPDGLPLVGPAPGLEGVDVLVAFNGHGLGLAVGLAEAWAAGVAGEGGEAAQLEAMFEARRFG